MLQDVKQIQYMEQIFVISVSGLSSLLRGQPQTKLKMDPDKEIK